MKTRLGFVSNSSSSSFIVQGETLDGENTNSWVHVSFIETLPYQQGNILIQMPFNIFVQCFELSEQPPAIMYMADNTWNITSHDGIMGSIIGMQTKEYVDRGEFDKVVNELGCIFLQSNLNFVAIEPEDSMHQRIAFRIS